MGSQSLPTEVTCYAGARYPERPQAFVYWGQRLEVVEVERRERTPRGPRFRVRIADGRRFWLSYDEADDAWDVRLSTRPRKQEGSP